MNTEQPGILKIAKTDSNLVWLISVNNLRKENCVKKTLLMMTMVHLRSCMRMICSKADAIKTAAIMETKNLKKVT